MQGKHSKNSSNSTTFRMRIWLRLVHRFYFRVYSIAEPYIFMYMYMYVYYVTHSLNTRYTCNHMEVPSYGISLDYAGQRM